MRPFSWTYSQLASLTSEALRSQSLNMVSFSLSTVFFISLSPFHTPMKTSSRYWVLPFSQRREDSRRHFQVAFCTSSTSTPLQGRPLRVKRVLARQRWFHQTLVAILNTIFVSSMTQLLFRLQHMDGFQVLDEPNVSCGTGTEEESTLTCPMPTTQQSTCSMNDGHTLG